MKNSALYKVYALLREDVRPRIGQLLVVVALTAVVAFGEKAPILLLKPLWDRVLFPAASAASEPRASNAVLDAVVRNFVGVQERLGDGLYGAAAMQDPNVRRMAALWLVAAVILVVTLATAAAQYAFDLALALGRAAHGGRPAHAAGPAPDRALDALPRASAASATCSRA